MDANMTQEFALPEGVNVESDKETEQEVNTEQESTEECMLPELEKPKVKRPMFAYFEVGGQTYRLKLKASGIERLENKYKRNLMLFLDNIPSLSIMLDIVHVAMEPWHAGVKITHVKALYDKYIEEGGDQISFFKTVFLEIYKASGFFTQEALESMANASV